MLDEAPDTLIYSAIENFETQPDISSLARISENLKKTKELRDAKIDHLQKNVDELEAKLEELSSEIKALSEPSAAILGALSQLGTASYTKEDDSVYKVMNAKSVELDNLKVSLAKRLTDLESALNQMNMVKMNMARHREDLSHQKEQALATNIASNFNSNSMRISLYKSLGIHIEELPDGNDKIVVFGREKNLTSVLQVDEKYLDYFISNYIWDKLGDS